MTVLWIVTVSVAIHVHIGVTVWLVVFTTVEVCWVVEDDEVALCWLFEDDLVELDRLDDDVSVGSGCAVEHPGTQVVTVPVGMEIVGL